MFRLLGHPVRRVALVTSVPALITSIGLGFAQETIRVALGDTASVETLGLLVAIERAQERGLVIEMTEFAEEDLGNQAVIGGQADIGIGIPYAIIQKVGAPVRMFYQFSKLVFFPVVDVSYRSWQDLDGEPFTFHARGTGTEAMGDLIAAREGITFGRRSYVPGSENRVVALLQGTISATILDLANTKLLLEQAPDRFHVLPGIDIPPSDEVLSARQEWLDDNAEAAQILMTHAWALIFLLFAFALLASEGIGLIEKTQRVRSSARQ